MNVINDPSINANARAVGSGISNALSRLAENKYKQLEQRNTIKKYTNAGYSPEEAEFILAQPEKNRWEAAQSLAPQAQRQHTQQEQDFLQTIPEDQRAQAAQWLLKNNQPTPEQLMQAGVPEQMSGLNEFTQQEVPNNQIIGQQLDGQQPSSVAQKLRANGRLTPQEVAERYKQSQADRKEIIEKGAASRQTLRDLERMEELEKEGKLDTPGYVEFLKRSGLDIPALMNEGSEEFNKIAANFLRDAKQYFGGRISNYEVEQFLKTIPSLSQSPEGRKRVIANLKYIARAGAEKNKVLREVMANNRNVPPYDLLEQVDDKLDKRLDHLSSLFKKDLERPVPKGQNRLVTALQASLGSAASIPGQLIKGAGSLLGGVLGSKL